MHISGGHLNPAVSVAAWIMGQLELYLVPCYSLAQIIGGFIGYGFIYVSMRIPNEFHGRSYTNECTRAGNG